MVFSFNDHPSVINRMRFEGSGWSCLHLSIMPSGYSLLDERIFTVAIDRNGLQWTKPGTSHAPPTGIAREVSTYRAVNHRWKRQ